MRGAISFALRRFRYDLGALRYYRLVVDALRDFNPDVVHITVEATLECWSRRRP